jgi:two-component system cell cycle response regulator DivK
MANELILIVEDNELNLKLARDILQVKEYRTLEARTAEQGIVLAREQQPNLILMDVQLPGMDGVNALKQLKADSATASIPIAAFTASVMKSDRERIVNAGFDAYITKPIVVREFLEKISALCIRKTGVVP